MLEVVRLLEPEPEGLQVREVLRRLKLVLPPTEGELTLNASGALRYDTNVRWWSVGLSKAEFVTKAGGVWSITDKGRAALIEFPDADSFGFEIDRLYDEWKRRDSAAKASRGNKELADSVIARIPAGRWVTFTDVASIVGDSPGSLGIHLWQKCPPGWHRVAYNSGLISAERRDDEERADRQRRLLIDDGFDLDGPLPEDRQLTLGELAGILTEVKGGERAWLVRGTSVKGTSIVPEWIDEGFMSLSASMLPMLPLDASDEDIKAAVDSGSSTLGYSQREAKFDEILAFLHRMKPGHLVVTTAGEDVFIGEISGTAVQIESPGKRSNLRRPVDWDNADSPLAVSDLPSPLAGRLRSTADVVELTDINDSVAALRMPALDDDSADPEVVPEARLELLSDEVVERLLIGRVWLDEFVELLAERRQVILYGPPGTGKTYLAQEVAEALAGKGRVTLVQFHPSYAYEDFFEGYRPSSSAGGGIALQLVPGPLRKVVDAARENPGEPYFLIVDEINRANLAKVFGELYFLLEYRDRSIDLLYSSGDTGPAFTLPANVFLIGTMNTADRSIALVDSAMRRRFAFLSLHPEDQRLDQVLRQWLVDRSFASDRIDLLVGILVELNRRIADKDVKIGPSYLMTSTVVTDAGLDRVWRTSILPLLEEYHVGEGMDVAARYGLTALRKAIGVNAPERAANAGDEVAGEKPISKTTDNPE